MLTNDQIEDLAQLHGIAESFDTKVAIIGASALRCFIEIGRFTLDVDLVVALDLEDFEVFAGELTANGWMREPAKEHRWRGANGSLIDLMPAGPKLRAAKQIIWPESQFAMSLAGFDHVFAQSVAISFTPDIQFDVAPPPVIALLKIVAYTENPYIRQKDLEDLKSLLCRYEAESDRIFGDDVFAAQLDDFEYTNAFLLDIDVGSIATDDDLQIIRAFLRKHLIPEEDLMELEPDDLQQREAIRFQMQLKAFEKGLLRSLSADRQPGRLYNLPSLPIR